MLKKLRYLIAMARALMLEEELAERDRLAVKVRDPVTLLAMRRRREEVSADLARARADWTSFHPPGVRRTWRQA